MTEKKKFSQTNEPQTNEHRKIMEPVFLLPILSHLLTNSKVCRATCFPALAKTQNNVE